MQIYRLAASIGPRWSMAPLGSIEAIRVIMDAYLQLLRDNLHWLPVKRRIVFEVWLTVYAFHPFSTFCDCITFQIAFCGNRCFLSCRRNSAKEFANFSQIRIVIDNFQNDWKTHLFIETNGLQRGILLCIIRIILIFKLFNKSPSGLQTLTLPHKINTISMLNTRGMCAFSMWLNCTTLAMFYHVVYLTFSVYCSANIG